MGSGHNTCSAKAGCRGSFDLVFVGGLFSNAMN
jgi:hypothetical protein